MALLHRVTRICCDGLATSRSTSAQEVCCIGKHQCNATDKFVSSDKDATEAARVDVHTSMKPFLLLYRHQLIFNTQMACSVCCCMLLIEAGLYRTPWCSSMYHLPLAFWRSGGRCLRCRRLLSSKRWSSTERSATNQLLTATQTWLLTLQSA